MDAYYIAHRILVHEGIITMPDEKQLIEENFKKYFRLRIDELQYLLELYNAVIRESNIKK